MPAFSRAFRCSMSANDGGWAGGREASRCRPGPRGKEGEGVGAALPSVPRASLAPQPMGAAELAAVSGKEEENSERRRSGELEARRRNDEGDHRAGPDRQ